MCCVDITDVSSIDSGRPDTPDTDESSEVHVFDTIFLSTLTDEARG